MKRLLLGTAISALLGHLAGFLILLVLTALSLMLEDPGGAALTTALLSLGFGGALSGLFSRKTGAGLLSGLLSGFFFALVPLVVALFFGGSDFFGIGNRLLIALAAWVIAAVFSILGRKKGRKRSASLAARKKRLSQRGYLR